MQMIKKRYNNKFGIIRGEFEEEISQQKIFLWIIQTSKYRM